MTFPHCVECINHERSDFTNFFSFKVRWADIEERNAQMKMREIGFVVGQTNWNRMMDPSEGSSALTKTKIIPNRFQSQ